MEAGTGMALFVKVVEEKSFRGAAEFFGLSPSSVSKQITALEDRLGARLLNRTTRRLGLTEVGTAYFEQCKRILALVDEAEQAVSVAQATPRGLLRVSVPLAFGRMQLAPVLPEFLKTYPDVRVHVFSHDREVDLIHEGFDIAIRGMRLRDSVMVARLLYRNRRAVTATPDYWQRRGTPQTPDDLTRHNCLINPVYSPQRTWIFDSRDAKTGQSHYVVPVTGNLEFDNPIALRETTLKGLGVSLLPTYLVKEFLDTGQLQEALTDYTSTEPDIYLVYPSTQHLTSKVRVFVDFLLEKFKEHR